MHRMSDSDPQGSPRQISGRYSWVALVLSAIAGSVDGIGYLLLAKIFTSHMSGNTVAMTIYVASRNWHEAWRHFAPILIFFLGILAGLAVVDSMTRVKFSRAFSVIAGLEVVLLAAFCALARPPHQWMVVWPAAAMGLQNAMLRRVGHHSVRTTFITGMLTNTAQGIVEAVAAAFDRSSELRKKLADAAFYGAILLCFAAGGISGAFLDGRYGSNALLLPIFALCVLIFFDAGISRI